MLQLNQAHESRRRDVEEILPQFGRIGFPSGFNAHSFLVVVGPTPLAREIKKPHHLSGQTFRKVVTVSGFIAQP